MEKGIKIGHKRAGRDIEIEKQDSERIMNYLWGGMLLVGIVFGAFQGKMQEITDAALLSAREAVSLGITMTGVMALWVGLMEIARDSGLIGRLCRRIEPVVHFLFPNLPQKHPAVEHISMNMIANVLGLGWAATPEGLKAMEELQKWKQEKGDTPYDTASKEMCTFLILNISSLQLIPVNMIAYRAQYGSVNPAAIVGPGIMATAVSTGIAVVFCKMMDRRKNR